MMRMKHNFFYSLLFLCVVGMIGVYYFLYTPSVVTGNVVKHSEIVDQWGVQSKGMLFSRDIVYIHDLPTSLQKEGLVVECKYKDNFRDVIGLGDWGVVIDGKNCIFKE